MTRTAKQWAGIALSVVVILVFLFQRNRNDSRMQDVWKQKYSRTRMQIGWQLVNLRHEYGSQQMHISQNTALEIRRLWDDRDLLRHLLHHPRNDFPADSLIQLENLIARRAPLITVLREIERIEKINETE